METLIAYITNMYSLFLQKARSLLCQKLIESGFALELIPYCRYEMEHVVIGKQKVKL